MWSVEATCSADWREGKWESADKPGSVVGNHSSGIRVTAYLKQPTREHVWATRAARSRLPPYLALLQAGFTVPSSVATDAVRSYRTLSPLPFRLAANLGGLLSVALSVDSRPPGVTWRFALGARTFLHSLRYSDCLADFGAQCGEKRMTMQSWRGFVEPN